MALSTPSFADPELNSYNAIISAAKETGQRVLGSIHSHVNWPPVMSPTDMRTHLDSKDIISGIVEVTSGRTRVVFWTADSALPCELLYT